MKQNKRMGQYLGRQATAKNLLGHLLKGTSAIIAGGPRMGKTTFLQQTAAEALQKAQPVYIDLLREKLPDLDKQIPDSKKPVILLLDNCDTLLPDPSPLLQHVSQFGKQLRATVWTGRVRWGEWAMARKTEFQYPIRYYPLIVLPPKEARPYIKHHLPADVPAAQVEQLIDLSRGHPYLLSRIVAQREGDLDGFFADLWKAVDSPTEHHVLKQLIEAGSWVLLHDLKDKAGKRVSKAVLDRLAIIGLINRTLVDGAAVATTVSPLLGDWVRRHV